MFLPFLVLLAPAADVNVFPKGSPVPRAMLRTFLLAECKKHFDARRAEVAQLKTAEQVKARQKRLREKFIEALGGFPERTPLKARVVGTLKREGYTVEKVIYESRPDHHVTANFYRPAGKGPFPAVLMPIGHSNNGKAAGYVQRGCILLAKNGIAALAYDPIGQGERRQLLDDKGKPGIPSSTAEHTLTGVGAMLVGGNTATYRIWDGTRGLDYLCSRPDVDAKKLGCTGCSGGGTLTSYLMVLDERVAVAAPSCYLTSLERLFETIGPQDAEQNVTGQVAFGLEHADYIGLRAPKPTLLCAATHDFFDIAGTWTSFREAKRLYTLLGHPERLDILESNTKHGWPASHREGMARWMKRWLLGKDEALASSMGGGTAPPPPPEKGDFKIEKDADLQCTRSGQVLDDLKGVSTFGLNLKRARELAKGRGAVTRADVAKLLGLKYPPTATAKKALGFEVETLVGRARKMVFETEPGVKVPALLIGAGTGPLVVYVHDQGKQAYLGPIARRVKEGKRVLAVDLRGWGETAPGPVPKKRGHFGNDFKESYLALHLGRPLLGQRVHDLLAIIAEASGKVEVVGVGKGGLVVLHAAALSDNIKKVRIENALVSWENVVETPLSIDQLTQAVPGALAKYDLPQLAKLMAPRPLEIVNPVDATGKPLSEEAAKKAYAGLRAGFTLKVGAKP